MLSNNFSAGGNNDSIEGFSVSKEMDGSHPDAPVPRITTTRSPAVNCEDVQAPEIFELFSVADDTTLDDMLAPAGPVEDVRVQEYSAIDAPILTDFGYLVPSSHEPSSGISNDGEDLYSAVPDSLALPEIFGFEGF